MSGQAQAKARWIALWVIGFFGLFGAANAQTPSSPAAGTQFDGTYAFVSSTKVNETYMQTKTARIGQCGNGIVGPLSIVNGQARYSGPNRDFEGTVGPQGELVMRRHEEPVNGGETPGRGAATNGKIDSNGTARSRQVGGWRSHDLTWQREPNPAKPEPN